MLLFINNKFIKNKIFLFQIKFFHFVMTSQLYFNPSNVLTYYTLRHFNIINITSKNYFQRIFNVTLRSIV